MGGERLKIYGRGSKGKQRAAVDVPGKWPEGKTKPKLMIPRRNVNLRYITPLCQGHISFIESLRKSNVEKLNLFLLRKHKSKIRI